jgi:endonuclease YncB( thermonuclease family)
MPFLRTALGSAILVLATSASGASAPRSEALLVRAVIDGDTIDVATVGRVRLLGIDAPELGRGFDTAAPFGQEARERLTSLVLHRWVRLEQDGAPLDVYNRHLAYVMREDGLFVNAAMLRDGLARLSARAPLARLDELRRAERDAQAFRRGMWGDAPRLPSPEYTHRSTAAPAGGTRARGPRQSSAPRRSPRKRKS